MSTKSRIRAIGVAVLAASVLAGTGLAGPARAAGGPGWTQPGYGPGRTFYNPDESVINAASIDDVRYRWRIALPDIDGYSCTGPSEPLVSGGRLFLTDERGIGVYAAATGKPLWRHTFAWPEDESTPRLAVSGGLLVAGNHGCQSQSDPDGYLRAFDVATGRQRWSAETDAPVYSLVVDRGVAVVSGDSPSDVPAAHGFRVRDGKRLWSALNYSSPGVSAGGRLLLSRTDHTLTAAASITTGKVLWSKTKQWYGRAAGPAGDSFLVSDGSGNLLRLKSSTGATVWTAKGAATELATDGRRIYRVITNGIQALDARNGKRLWTASVGGGTGRPVRAGGLVYTTVDAGGRIAILHAATGRVASPGRQIGAHDHERHVVVAGGRLYTLHGNVAAAYAP